MRGKRLRRLQLGCGAGLVAVLLASCSSSPSTPSAAHTPHHATSSTASTASTTTTTVVTSPTTEVAPAPLLTGAPIELPFSAGAVTAAESPDGAVFAAPQDPTSTSASVAWVVDGNGPAAIAEHVATGVAAMAADANNFYVATYANVMAYSRASGNQDGQWNLPPVHTSNASDDDLVSMTAAGNDVVVSITQGTTVRVYRINPSSTAGPRLFVTSLGAVVGSDGSVYYESTDHHLDVRRPGGSTVTGPALADAPTQLGAGVQYVEAVAGGAVWVSEPAGQGLDATFTTFAASDLAKVATFQGSATDTVVDTSAGALVLEPAGASTCPASSPSTPSSCVYDIDQQGSVSNAAGVGAAVALIGPSPAVVSSDTSTNQFQLIRLS